ncbi:MAG: hypothetical protein SFT91_04055 [Rickettsiaceae bacterium]|nr:hypothetical protein [Rickettsiaceae bacterium]
MLRLFFILISSYALCGASMPKMPVMIQSKKMIANQLRDVITYEGDVRVEFSKYDIVTSKIIFIMKSEQGSMILNRVEFPEQTKIVTKDLKEVTIVPSAYFDAGTSMLKSSGDVTVEKDGSFYKTLKIEIDLGKFVTVQMLKS